MTPDLTCDDVQVALSAAFDGELDAAAGDLVAAQGHADGCPDCRRFAEHLEASRSFLRAEPPGRATASTTDLAAAVLTQVRREDAAATTAPTPPARVAARGDRRRRGIPAAAVFVAAALGAALLVHTSTDGPDVASADLAERVIAAQHEVTALSASVTIVERGWNPAVPERRFAGTLRYRAPESLSLSLRDQTTYPDASWPANDLGFTVDEDTWTVAGLRDCPSPAQPGCNPPRPDHRTVTGREPFAVTTPAPLDLIMPVQSFALAGTIATLPDADVGGRPTVGIEATAAQVGPLLSGVRPTGNLRQVHPADPVELRLDRDTLVPLQVTVVAGDGRDRRAWAASRGYVDEPGTTIVELTLTDVEVNAASDQPFAPPPPPAGSDQSDGLATTDAGFRDGDDAGSVAPVPERLPTGLQPYRAGLTDTEEGPAVATRTWTDGRAWLAVSATAEWPGGRLFGDLGGVVRTIDLGAAGVGYLSEDGERVGLHADGLDVVVAGSVSRPELIEAASTLSGAGGQDVSGRAVPSDWDEAGTAGVAEARAAITPLLLPVELDGFGSPALRVDETGVTASFAGAGDRSFALDQSVAPKLPPPAFPGSVVEVTVRGGPGRYAVDRGELEWYGPEGHLYRLRSLTLSRGELLAIADGLAPA